ncbi:TPA: LamG domain-containing protein [Candidatus Poribacteria bacterium]|nr:LamG domain-containing protein [Candidatus Poribacteria bacterium]
MKALTFIFAFALMSLGFMFIGGIAGAQIVTDGLIAYWPLDKDTVVGKTVKDVIGGNDGTIVGNPKLVPGRVGDAMEFDGDDGIDIQGTDALNLQGKNQFTAAAWVNVGSDDPVVGVVAKCCGEIVAQRDANGWCLRYDGRNGGQEMEFIIHSAAGWEGDGGFGAPLFGKGEWHYFVGVLDGKSMKIYVDGELVKEQNFVGPSIASTGPKTEIGRAGDGGFIGLIDEVTIYNRPLSEEEIKQNYNAKGLAVGLGDKLATLWGKIKMRR